MLEDPRLDRNKIRVPRRDNYEKRLVLSATIHPDIKRTLVGMSERTGMTVSQVTDEVLYAGLIEIRNRICLKGRTHPHSFTHRGGRKRTTQQYTKYSPVFLPAGAAA